jgi:dipeptidyl aminopeptidase/acylaminoacyl peptidase
MVLQMPVKTSHLLTAHEAEDNVRGFDAAIDSLSAQGLIDPDRVGIIGFSRTCWYVESALVKDPGRFAAASIADGMDHGYMQSMLFDLDRPTSEIQKTYGAQPFGAGLQKWLALSPPFSLDRVQTPVMITAIGPGSVLAEWELYSSLHQQKKAVDLLYIPHGQHILQKPLDRLASQQTTVDWFRYWLQNYKQPHPYNQIQYERWGRLRDLFATTKSRISASSSR